MKCISMQSQVAGTQVATRTAAKSVLGLKPLPLHRRVACLATDDKVPTGQVTGHGSDSGKFPPLPQERENKDTFIWPASDPKVGGPALSGEIEGPGYWRAFNEMNEAINGRSAMLGFVAAVAGELLTRKTVYDQLAGVNTPVTPPYTASIGLFIAIVVINTVATLVPYFKNGERPGDRQNGIFTPQLEFWTGRVAMLGFFGLVGIELLSGNIRTF